MPSDPNHRPPAGRRRGPVSILIGCVAVAAVGTIAVDSYSDGPEPPGVDRRAVMVAIGAPDPAQWRVAPLVPGALAPAFDLTDVRTESRLSLGAFRGRPVVLLLSSFGCNVFCGELRRIVALHERYRNDAAFLFVAIRDAGHPDPEFSPPVGEPLPGESVAETRLRLVRDGAAFLNLPFPTVLDADGSTEAAYDAFPKRLVIVGRGGRIVYDGGRGSAGGPSNWDLQEVEEHLRSALSAGQAAE